MYVEINNDLRMRFQSDLKPVFYIIKEYCKNLVWLISHHEFQYLNDEPGDQKLKPLDELIKIDGKELIDVIEKNEIQFIWGVLSGCKELSGIDKIDFKKSSSKNYDANEYVYDDALIEIDCFDSSSTIIRCRDKNILEILAAYFETHIHVD